MKFFEDKLPNGLRVIGELREGAKSTAAGFFVKAGARDESPEISGVSHFLEHMMFKGTDKRGALDISNELGQMGAQANAFTSEENTVYYASVLPEFRENLIELLSDMMRPKLDPEEFATEKNVILEEIEMYQDRPTHILFEKSMEIFFGSSGAGNSVLGSSDSIKTLSVEQMNKYFKARYSPNNMTLAVAGKFDFDEVVAQARELCGGWESQEVSRNYRERKPEHLTKKLSKKDMKKSHACFLADGPSYQDERKYAAHVLACILGDGSGSRAYWQIIDKGLADSASIGIECMDNTGVIYGYLGSDPDRLESVSETFLDILKSGNKIEKDELERAKTKIKTRFVLQGESSLKRAMSIGLASNYSMGYRSLAEEIDLIEKVNEASIAEFLEGFSLDNFTRVSLLPQ